MRISDWSSDVCSSDLLRGVRKLTREAGAKQAASAGGHRDRDDVAIHPGAPIGRIADQEMDRQRLAAQPAIRRPGYRAHARQIDRVPADRKAVGQITVARNENGKSTSLNSST